QRWRDAKDGEGHAIFISGLPGIGKSRIMYELNKLIEGERHWSLSFQCLPHCMQSPLFPVIQRIGRLAEFSNDDTEQVKLEKIENVVGRATDQISKAVPFIAEMMSVKAEPRYAQLPLTAIQMKTQTLFVLIELLLELSMKRPVVCMLEDAQWIDPSTQE